MRAERVFFIFKSFSESVFAAVVFVFIPIVFVTLLASRTNLLGLQSFTVLSGSMSPLIETGSVVYTFPVSTPQVGDIITFKKGSINVTHRIVDTVDKSGKHVSAFASPVSGNGYSGEVLYKTKGDANSSADSDLVSRSQIIGAVQFHFPSLGKFASFIKSVPGFLSLIVLPTFGFIGMELWNIKREIEREVEKKTLRKIRMYGYQHHMQ